MTRAKSELRAAQQRTITRLYVDEALAYDPETGVLTWRERPLHHFKHVLAQRCWNARFAGKPAGCVHVHGYMEVKLLGLMWKAHHLIWVIVHGYLPVLLDHEDGKRARNVLTNLREATKQENNRNTKRPKTNTSGSIGVSLDRRGGRWRAYIKEGDRNVSLGYYASRDEAAAARRAAEQRLGYHPNHGREA